ncbi:hypothetical protein [Pelomicrobium sp.]|jgi:hypothetical protein
MVLPLIAFLIRVGASRRLLKPWHAALAEEALQWSGRSYGLGS